MLNIVLPIAGRGSRFADAGYTTPKPLIPVHGVPMIEVVVNNVRPAAEHRFTFLTLQEHLDHTDMLPTLRRIAPGCEIIPVNQVTEGAACTVLLARDVINNDNGFMIVNSDQYVDADINAYLAAMDERDADGLIMTFWADHPKWSYVRLNEEKFVTEVIEKVVVSNDATVGIYNFRHGRDYVRGAERMIAKDLRVNGEFYVAPVYNEIIADDAKVVIYNVGEENNGMYGLGIPGDLDLFLANDVSRRATKLATTA
jgi:dTDP-glucose pyrophosphorylase